MNWDEEYRKMLKALTEYFHMANGMDADLVDEACSLAKSVSSRSTEKALYRLNELAVKWVLKNPEPLGLEKVEYNR